MRDFLFEPFSGIASRASAPSQKWVWLVSAGASVGCNPHFHTLAKATLTALYSR
jgi:hypothetical protein